MAAWWDDLQLYFRYIGISVRGQMQYRASFVMLMIGHFLATVAEFLGLVVLFDRFGHLKGWSLPQVALLYGTVNIAFGAAEAAARGFDTFSRLIKAGDFDRVLLRPRSTALQIAAQEMQMMRAGRMLQGLFVLFWCGTRLGVHWTPARAAVVAAMILGSACLFYGLMVLQATMAFWTVETLEIMNTVTYGGTEVAQYPMSIYRPWFRGFFTFVVPLACTSYYPAAVVFGRHSPIGPGAAFPWLLPLVGVAFLVFTLQVWKLGVSHYHSTGS